jgi:hypothetical protein
MDFNFNIQAQIHVHHRERHYAIFRWHVGPVTRKEHTTMPLEVTITSEEKVRVTATPQTAAGHPASVDGQVMFAVQNGECTVTQVDAVSADVFSGDIPGDSAILVTADADLGTGVQTIMDTILVHVTHPNAASLGLQAGPAELK